MNGFICILVIFNKCVLFLSLLFFAIEQESVKKPTLFDVVIKLAALPLPPPPYPPPSLA